MILQNSAELISTVIQSSKKDESIDLLVSNKEKIDIVNIVNDHLEKKNADNLIKIKNFLSKKGIPFAIKGIFLEEDIELVQKVKPDVVYVSNHGGRVDTREGSTAEFLASHYKTLLSNAGELWVDGGIRKLSDFNKAASYGASSVLVGRPFITALCSGKPFSEILR